MDTDRIKWASLWGSLLVSSVAFAESPVYSVSCPQFWPGPGNYAYNRGDVWRDWLDSPHPDDMEDTLRAKGPGEIQLDCAYGKATSSSPFHVTMVLPGYPQRCYYASPRRGVWILQCDVRPEADGSIGPVMWRVAEVIGPGTRFLGFGLDQTPDAVRAAAQLGGFAVAETSTERWELTRGDERLIAIFAGGATVEASWVVPAEPAARMRFWREFLFRFGLHETYAVDHDTDRQTVRESPDGSVRIETYGDPSGRTGGRVRLVRGKA